MSTTWITFPCLYIHVQENKMLVHQLNFIHNQAKEIVFFPLIFNCENLCLLSVYKNLIGTPSILSCVPRDIHTHFIIIIIIIIIIVCTCYVGLHIKEGYHTNSKICLIKLSGELVANSVILKQDRAEADSE